MTDATAALPPAGWYPDPEIPGQIRWWDGFQWQVSKPLADVYRPLRSSFSVLGWILAALISGLAVLFAGRIVLSSWASGTVVQSIRDGDLETAQRYDAIDRAMSLGVLGLIVPAMIIWCVWQYQAAAATDRDELRRSPRMHVLSWLIPFASLWFPLQNIRDLWNANVGERRRLLLGWWWAFFMAANISTRVSDEMGKSMNDLHSFSNYVVSDAIHAALWVIACLLALHLVITLTLGVAATSRQREAAMTA
jgi:hypothetical protein